MFDRYPGADNTGRRGKHVAATGSSDVAKARGGAKAEETVRLLAAPSREDCEQGR